MNCVWAVSAPPGWGGPAPGDFRRVRGLKRSGRTGAEGTVIDPRFFSAQGGGGRNGRFGAGRRSGAGKQTGIPKPAHPRRPVHPAGFLVTWPRMLYLGPRPWAAGLVVRRLEVAGGGPATPLGRFWRTMMGPLSAKGSGVRKAGEFLGGGGPARRGAPGPGPCSRPGLRVKRRGETSQAGGATPKGQPG